MMIFLFATLATMLAVSYVDASSCELDYNPVVFSVGITTQNAKIANGDIVKFDHVFTKVGGGYNTVTGMFTSPDDGTYLFSFNGLAPPDHELYLSLYKNSDQVVSIWGSVKSYYATASNTVIIPLKKGDTVYIKSRRNFDLYAAQSQTYATFSGYKLPFV